MGLTIIFHKLRSQDTPGIIDYILVQWRSVALAYVASIVSYGNNILFFPWEISPFFFHVVNSGTALSSNPRGGNIFQT